MVTGYLGATLKIALADSDKINLDLWKVPNSAPAKNSFGEFIPLYYEEAGWVHFPRNNMPELECIIEERNYTSSIETGYFFHQEYRDYQVEVVDKALKFMRRSIRLGIARDVIICAPCASGKTHMAFYAIDQLAVKTLIAVPTEPLFKQWVERLTDWTGEEPGMFTGRKKSFKNITVALVPSLISKLAKKYQHELNKFALLINDEVHRLGADKWSKAVCRIPAGYRLSFSATPKRGDGLDIIMFSHCGQVVAEVSRKQLIEEGYIKNPKVFIFERTIPTLIQRWNGFNWAATCTKIARHSVVISDVQHIIKQSLNKGKKTMVLTNRLELIQPLKELFPDAFLLVGVSNLEEAIDREKLFKAQLILAIDKLATTGIELPALSTMISVTPYADPSVIEQMLGRNSRPDSIDPVFVDYYIHEPKTDKKDFLKFMFQSRLKVYESLECEVTYVRREE